MTSLSALSYVIGAGAFFVLATLLVTAWRGRLEGGLLVAAALVSVVWCVVLGLHSATGSPGVKWVTIIEVLRSALWVVFVIKLLSYRHDESTEWRRSGLVGRMLFYASVAVLLVYSASTMDLASTVYQESSAESWPVLLGFLGLTVVGLALVEQLYRRTRPEHRWGIKFLCLGVGGLFVYDFFLYAHAVLFNHIDFDLWSARGLVNALAVPLIAVAAARNPTWSVEIFVSRHVVFHSAAVLGAGTYLLVMAAVGYYIRLYGGTWGGPAQIVFFFGAAMLLLLLLFSGHLRSRAKVVLGKHFFKNKYDYREEWLKFTDTLSRPGGVEDLHRNAIQAIASIIGSPAGCMWLLGEDGLYRPVSAWERDIPAGAELDREASLVRFLESSGWVVFMAEYNADAEHYTGLELPDWIRTFSRSWVIAPLMQEDSLLGFVVLSEPYTKRPLNWEDSDLLKTVGRQAAGHLALAEANDALSESRQFEAFNRLSSFVVHDLKNLVAQLSLVSRNASKHMDNPEFIEDAMNTVEHATNKMNRLLAQLRKGRLEETDGRMANVGRLLEKVVALRAQSQPAPRLVSADGGLVVSADPDRLAAVFEHLIQNAQEATPADGYVHLRARRDDDAVVIEIEDNGSGMDASFVRDRLFRPFDTTKGNAGMGIGVYETRQFVTGRGGVLDVATAPGQGTTFTIRLPAEFDGSSSQQPTPSTEVSSERREPFQETG